jgi:Restriction endonuclease
MPIFDREPNDWRDLQAMVAQLFRELGCEVEIGRQVELVRGRKEIDVWVRDEHIVPHSEYLCECKFWNRAVPQEVVHSFRTVVSDYGAHRGFIISKAGFQSGAHEAAENTNIQLVTFDQLQAIFFDRWRIVMGEHFMPYADRLFPYWDYPGKMPQFRWGEAEIKRQQELVAAYSPLLRLGPVARMQGFVQRFPVTVPSLNAAGEADGEIVIQSYRQLYDFFAANKDAAYRYFQLVYGEIEA